jgi:hypothetical protein
METVEYIIRKEGQGTFGLGEVITPGCTLFRSGFYNLTKEELDHKVKSLTPKTS